jgi:hypothetical protein
MDAVEALSANEAFQGLQTERELPGGQRTLVAKRALAEPRQVLRKRVLVWEASSPGPAEVVLRRMQDRRPTRDIVLVDETSGPRTRTGIG